MRSELVLAIHDVRLRLGVGQPRKSVFGWSFRKGRRYDPTPVPGSGPTIGASLVNHSGRVQGFLEEPTNRGRPPQCLSHPVKVSVLMPPVNNFHRVGKQKNDISGGPCLAAAGWLGRHDRRLNLREFRHEVWTASSHAAGCRAAIRAHSFGVGRRCGTRVPREIRRRPATDTAEIVLIGPKRPFLRQGVLPTADCG